MKTAALAWGICASLAAFAFAPRAHAHISLEQGGTHLSRYGDGELKAGPCGRSGGTRGSNVYTYAPGQTITVKVAEVISHPGYFRLAFDVDGDDGFKEPASIKPVDSNRACPDGPGDHCGASDYYNSPEVLPNMDDLEPHLAGATKTYSWQVTLPNVECNNCTLQVIQVMEDDQYHGPYDPTPGVGIPDIYHQCIDIVLARTADGGPPSGSDAGDAGGDGGNPSHDAGRGGSTPPGSSGSTGSSGSAGSPSGGADGGATGLGGGGSSSGCSAAGTGAAPLFAGLLAAAAGGLTARRRRRGREHRRISP